jgi:hypothetical protein
MTLVYDDPNERAVIRRLASSATKSRTLESFGVYQTVLTADARRCRQILRRMEHYGINHSSRPGR